MNKQCRTLYELALANAKLPMPRQGPERSLFGSDALVTLGSYLMIQEMLSYFYFSKKYSGPFRGNYVCIISPDHNAKKPWYLL
jgi:hypothetical protein